MEWYWFNTAMLWTILWYSKRGTCNTLPWSHRDLIRGQSRLIFQSQRILCLASCCNTISSSGQPLVLDAKQCFPFTVPPGLYSSSFSITSSKHPHIVCQEYISFEKIGFWDLAVTSLAWVCPAVHPEKYISVFMKCDFKLCFVIYFTKLTLPVLKKDNKWCQFIQLIVNKSVVETFCVFIRLVNF